MNRPEHKFFYKDKVENKDADECNLSIKNNDLIEIIKVKLDNDKKYKQIRMNTTID